MTICKDCNVEMNLDTDFGTASFHCPKCKRIISIRTENEEGNNTRSTLVSNIGITI